MQIVPVPARLSPIAAGFVGAGQRMTPADIAAAAARLGCEPAVIAAVLDVESAGSGFDAQGRPKILFEPHVFHRELQGKPEQLAAAERASLAYPHQGERPYPPTSEANYCRLKRACLLDPDAAMRSASWGVAQVMGFNYAVGRYASVSAMVLACMDSEAAQFGLLLGYAECRGLAASLRTRNFPAFARGYNGPGAVAQYAARLQAAYVRHSRGIVVAAIPRKPAGAASSAAMPWPAAAPAPARAPLGASPAMPLPSSAEVTADSLMDIEWLRIRSGLVSA